MTMHQAQLYWDSQDPRNAGWWLRYRDAEGTEQGIEVGGAEDADVEDLADRLEEERHLLEPGTIKVYRGSEVRGRITIPDDPAEEIDWRAL